MSDNAEATEESGSIPANEVKFPENMTNLVFGLYAIQTIDDSKTEPFVTELRTLLAGQDAPQRVERCHFTRAEIGHTTIIIAYWTDLHAAQAWHNGTFADWWAGLPIDEAGVGYWREVLTPEVGRFHFFGIGTPRVASSAVLDTRNSTDWGYWGGYRDRMASHDIDPFTSDRDFLPEPQTHATRGRRVRVSASNNLCFVREGADPSFVTNPMERELWETQLRPAHRKWVDYLADNPVASGCASMINAVEQDVETGADLDKATQFAYFLSLRHLERAARTQPSHLALVNTFMDVAGKVAGQGVDMGLLIWDEAHILREGELEAEYVNCDPQTGLLPFLAADVPATAPSTI